MASFSFPPESYSAVYDGKSEANGTVAPTNEAVEESSPTRARSSSTKSLFSCFHCAIPKRIKGIRKQKNTAIYKITQLSTLASLSPGTGPSNLHPA